MATGFESTSSSSCALAALFFLAALSAPSSAAERPFGDAFLLTYGNLESYCDIGTYKQLQDAEPKTFERCIHSDGRYKKTEQFKKEGGPTDAEWSDGSQVFYAHLHPVFGKWEFSHQALSPERHVPPEPFARTILEWFEIPVPGDVRESLNRFTRKADLDRDGLIAYEAWSYYRSPDLIIWVSTEDGLIRRTATPSAVNYRRVVDEVRTNAVLASSDLVFDVPLRARAAYFMRSNRASAAALLSLGVFLLGMAFWRIRWILIRDKDDRDDEDHRAIRNATLRRYAVVAGSLTLLAIAITALSGLAKGGHPPLIAIVAVFAVQIVGVLWLGMCFLIARHLMEIPRRAAPFRSREQS